MSWVRVRYEVGGGVLEGTARGLGAGSFLLTHKGSFCCFAPVPFTKYNGFFTSDGIKVIDHLSLAAAPEEVIIRDASATRVYASGAKETFTLDEGLHHSLTKYHGPLYLDLDIRPMTAAPREGRSYTIRKEERGGGGKEARRIIITYHHGTFHQKLTISMEGKVRFQPLGTWHERHYPYDARRGDAATFWVYRVGLFLVEGACTLHYAPVPEKGSSQRPVSATSLCHTAFSNASLSNNSSSNTSLSNNSPSNASLSNTPLSKTSASQPLFSAISSPVYSATPQGKKEVVVRIARRALDQLRTDHGVVAGLPWFNQYWSRDELISLGAYLATNDGADLNFAKGVLYRYAEALDQEVQACPGGLRAADALGWLALRIEQAAPSLTPLERAYFRDRLLLAANRTRQALQQTHDGLLQNGPRETWMDTVARDGARIEIQAGIVALFRTLAHLAEMTGKEEETFLAEAAQLRERVRSAFLRDGGHAGQILDGRFPDGTPDLTVRPNLFIAYALAPELFTADEWNKAFQHATRRLWLPWGGLATIDTGDPRFHREYTGMDDQSYHQGDSWYWLNLLAAGALRAVGMVEEAEALERAAIDDLLWQGVAGAASELSNAAVQEWGGTYSQAWSSAMLLENALSFGAKNG